MIPDPQTCFGGGFCTLQQVVSSARASAASLVQLEYQFPVRPFFSPLWSRIPCVWHCFPNYLARSPHWTPISQTLSANQYTLWGWWLSLFFFQCPMQVLDSWAWRNERISLFLFYIHDSSDSIFMPHVTWECIFECLLSIWHLWCDCRFAIRLLTVSTSVVVICLRSLCFSWHFSHFIYYY